MESELQTTKEVKKSNITTNIVAGLALIISIILVVFIVNLNDQVVSLKSEVNKLQNIDKVVSANQYNAFISTVQHKMESADVTDDFSLNKINIVGKDIVIDVDAQPSTGLKYQGKGKFNMQDREVKAMIGDFLDYSKDMYNKLLKQYDGEDPMPKWEDESITVTIKGYEIGTYKNGKFYLKGETN